MCTAISETGKYHLFGRTLDLECSYGEGIAITPRNYELSFRHGEKIKSHSAIIGVAHVSGDMPLYYDAMNEEGLAIAALNFPHNAVYNEPLVGKFNVASFELILWVLAKCKSVDEARALLDKTNITNDAFSEGMPATPLHFMISDKHGSISVEPLSGGLKIYDDPFGVLTNNPTFDYHLTNVANYMSLSSEPPKNNICPSVDLECYSRGMGGIGLPGDYSSASRFVRAVFVKNHTVHTDDEMGEVSRFFHIMDTVSVPCGCVKTDEGRDVLTVYTSCANTDTGKYYYTTYSERSVRVADMSTKEIDGCEIIAKKL